VRRRTWLVGLFLAAITIGCYQPPPFLQRSVTLSDNTYRYRVWLPRHYTKLRRWPVVLYLHGSGERGDDNVRQLTAGLPIALQRYQTRYHCVVVIPQCRDGREWYGEMEQQALAALDKSVDEFRGDRRRVYVTGISLGGAGTWYMARHRKRFAAIVPVCGEVWRKPDDPFPTKLPPDLDRIVHAPNPFVTLAAAIGKTPVWAFHGADDQVIPVTESRAMVAALRARGANVHYTEYLHGGHTIWDEAYGDAGMVEWLLSQRR
jgi:predicted peptidase